MLTDHDKKTFSEIIKGTAGAYGREVSPIVMRMFWGVLSKYEIHQVEAAFSSHLQTSRFMPTIAEIVERIEMMSGQAARPGPDEAWAMIPKDEQSSQVVTQEMLGAYGVAAHMIHDGDLIAARMAFKDAYTRLCEESKTKGRPVEWVLSRGWDKETLGQAVSEAVRLGRMTPEKAAPYLAEIGYQAPMIAGLLEGTKGTRDEGKAREFLSKLKATLTPPPTRDTDTDAIRREVDEKDRRMMDGHV